MQILHHLGGVFSSRQRISNSFQNNKPHSIRRTTQSPLLRHCCTITRNRRMRSSYIISSALDRFLHNAPFLNKQPPPEHISNGGILFSLRPLNQAFCLFRDFWVTSLKWHAEQLFVLLYKLVVFVIVCFALLIFVAETEEDILQVLCASKFKVFVLRIVS